MRYTDNLRTAVVLDGQMIPRSHRFWVKKGIAAAEAAGEILPWIDTTPPPEDPSVVKEREEREWRDEELAKADVELFIIQDGRGTRTVGELRDWRNMLRDYPEHELFPNGPRPPYVEDAPVIEEE